MPGFARTRLPTLLADTQNLLMYFSLGAALLGLLIGALITWLHAQRELQDLSIENTRLTTELARDQQHFDAQLKQLNDARENLSQHFAVLSRQALKDNSSLFLRLAGENLKIHRQRATSDLQQREMAIDNLVAPIKEALNRTEEQIKQIENERKQSFGSLSQQIETLTRAEIDLRSETNHLVNALKRPDVRGRWGEMTLKRLIELAGMVEHCDFDEQVKTLSDDNRLRPDMIVRMPGQREIIIDAKAPLDGYLSAIDADTEQLQKAAMVNHARNLRDRVKSLASKSYWAQFSHSPDFVVLFIPGDQFLTAALAEDADLLEFGMKHNIILATPSSLMGLLRAVAFGWKQIAFSENTEQIRQLGEELHRRIATLTEHFQRLGKSLNSSVEHYNKTLGSLERQLMPGARRMTELGIHAKKTPADLSPIEQSTRPAQSDSTE